LLSTLMVLALRAADGRAESVEVAPFAGYQFGGSFLSPALGEQASLNGALVYGGTLDVPFSRSWRVELLYSRQQTEVAGAGGGPRFDVRLERYLGGVVEEKGDGRTRFFGAGLVGVTRFVPGLTGFDSDARLTLAVGLGLKHFLSDRFGLRAEARGFYTFTDSGGGVFCNQGLCLFAFSGEGLWQGEVSGGVVFAF